MASDKAHELIAIYRDRDATEAIAAIADIDPRIQVSIARLHGLTIVWIYAKRLDAFDADELLDLIENSGRVSKPAGIVKLRPDSSDED